MTEITHWLAEATAERLERMAEHVCVFANELEDMAIGLEVLGIEPSDFEHFSHHPLIVLVNALCEREQGSDMVYLDIEQQASLIGAARCLRALV